MERLGQQSLVHWLNQSHRKPLILRGARQVGKSTLVRLFAKSQNLELIEINLERYLYLNDIFKSYDINLILNEIEGITGSRPHENSLLFLDEIQATPEAIAALRYFYEDAPQLPVITAGSLLKFTLSDHSYSMPVGRVEYRHLGPMTFKEFLMCIEPELVPKLEQISPTKPIPEGLHQRFLKRCREYFFVGGMPEAVKAFSVKHSFEDAQDVHRSICDTYLDDFSKYAQKSDLLLMQNIFRKLPRLVGKKIKYSELSSDHRAAEVKRCLDLLHKAKIIDCIYASHCNGLPLQAEIKEKVFKCLWVDIGLSNYLCGNDWLAISSMDETQLINEGSMAEQFIGQHLSRDPSMKSKPELTYWLREKGSSNSELDYVTSRGNWIVPIEVKSGKSGRLKSLHQFHHEKQAHMAIRFDLNPPSIQDVVAKLTHAHEDTEVNYPLISLPLYAAEQWQHIIDGERSK